MACKYYLPNEATTASPYYYNAVWDAYFDALPASVVGEVPNTTEDMKAMMEWEHGDTIYGTEAKGNKGMLDYRKDIDADWGTQDSYKHIYIDIFKDKPIGPRLKKGDV